ncbi:MAG: tyrosine-type recombinase/integrase [Nitriliruptorales bacterium]
MNPDWLSHEFKRLCATAGVPPVRPHDVRHTHASLLLASGEHLKVVQERLGWASTAFMLETCTHLLPGMQAQAAERFAARLFAKADEKRS